MRPSMRDRRRSVSTACRERWSAFSLLSGSWPPSSRLFRSFLCTGCPNSNSFFYTILGIFLAASFLAFPLKKSMVNKAPNILDWVFAALSLGCALYFAYNAVIIISQGWDMTAPLLASVLGGILCLLSIEGARRAAGGPLAGVCLFFGVYPLFADHMPGIFWGNSFSLQELAAAHAMGPESIIGLPFRTVAELLFGYIVFGVALAVTGGGEFFIGLAMKLLGRTRGGTAKVSIFASALFGSLSGSPVSNVVTIGTFTIPAMKKSGYPGTFACAIEACASTGGALMPPVMGAAAFIMASFLNVPYVEVAMAAVIPSFLFYFTLFHAGPIAMPPPQKWPAVNAEDVPSAAAVLRTGWVFAAALLVLIYVLLFLRLEIYAPWYATLVVIVGGLCDPLYRSKILQFRKFFIDNGHTLGQLVSILAGVGMVVGALAITGVGSAFARELVQYAHGNVYLLLFFGALTSFILGMGMTVSACYILLAIVLAPALIQAGLNPMASPYVHHVLGHPVGDHAAGRRRGHRGGGDRQGRFGTDRLHRDAARLRAVHRPNLLCAQSRPGRAGHRAGDDRSGRQRIDQRHLPVLRAVELSLLRRQDHDAIPHRPCDRRPDPALSQHHHRHHRQCDLLRRVAPRLFLPSAGQRRAAHNGRGGIIRQSGRMTRGPILAVSCTS